MTTMSMDSTVSTFSNESNESIILTLIEDENGNDLPTDFSLCGARRNVSGNFFEALINLHQRIRDICDWSVIKKACETRNPEKIWTDGRYIIMYVPSHPETNEDTFVLLQKLPEEIWMPIEYSSYKVQDKHQNPDIFSNVKF